jgi:GNAT superfamily N-acetyltransferase
VDEVDVQAVGPDQLDAVRILFDGERATRHCSCMAFCETGWQFVAGWYGGGNRRRFEAMTVSSHLPVGALASVHGQPVGWCACGPRSRYTAAIRGRSTLLAARPRDEDEDVWLVACVYVDPLHRGTGVAIPLLRAAVALARQEGASAIEAWPLATGVTRPGYEHVGREAVFARLGFRCIQRPSADRAIMRLELTDDGSLSQ